MLSKINPQWHNNLLQSMKKIQNSVIFSILFWKFHWWAEKDLTSSFNLALPLQSFGSVSVFQKSQDFPRQFFGCSEVLHMSQIRQESNFDLHGVLKANFHINQEFNAGQIQSLDIQPPFLFYLTSSDRPALIHLFGRVLNWQWPSILTYL